MNRHRETYNAYMDVKNGLYDDYGDDQYGNEYGDYGDEDYYNQGNQPDKDQQAQQSNNKSTKKLTQEEAEVEAAIAASLKEAYGDEYDPDDKPEQPKQPKKPKKPKKAQPTEEQIQSICHYFVDMDTKGSHAGSKASGISGLKKSKKDSFIFKVTEQYVKQQLIEFDLDVDKTIENITYNKNKKEGNQTFQKSQQHKKEEEKKKQQKEDDMEKYGKVQNPVKQLEKKVKREKVSKEVLNADHPDQDYNIQLDKATLQKDINLVIIGHVDSGKSTLMGHILHQMGQVKKHEVNKMEKLTEQYGKSTFEFAFFMDQDEEERRHGVTINLSKAYFETTNKNVTVLDSPGHRDFIPNMIQGACQADAAVLVVDSRTGAYEHSMTNGTTRSHAILAKSVGVNQLVIAVNKLDTVDWSEERYDHICNDISKFLKKINYRVDKMTFVPISGLKGINLHSRDNQPEELKQWYNDTNGEFDPNKKPRCLIEVIDGFYAKPRPLKRPMRACIYDYYQNKQDGFSVCQGECLSIKVESGVLKKKDKLLIMPQNIECEIKAIEHQKKPSDFVYSGQIAEVCITFPLDFDRQFMNDSSLLCDPKHPMYPVRKFRAKIFIFEIQYPVTLGQEIVVHAFSIKIPGKISCLDHTIDVHTKDVKKSKPKRLVENDYALITIKLDQRVCLELHKNNRSMGRIALRDEEITIGAGHIEEFVY